MSRDDPFVIPADELPPVLVGPAEAPPPPDEEPRGEAMQRVTRLRAAAGEGRRLFWGALAGWSR